RRHRDRQRAGEEVACHVDERDAVIRDFLEAEFDEGVRQQGRRRPVAVGDVGRVRRAVAEQDLVCVHDHLRVEDGLARKVDHALGFLRESDTRECCGHANLTLDPFFVNPSVVCRWAVTYDRFAYYSCTSSMPRMLSAETTNLDVLYI